MSSRSIKKVKKITVDPSFTEGDKELSFQEWLRRKLDEMFTDNFPLGAIRDLPEKFMYTFGTFAYIVSLACFFYFIVVGYQTAMNTKFVSLCSGNSCDAEGVCSDVTRTVSGTFLASNDGYWQGQENFQYAKAQYIMSFYSYGYTLDEFKAQMDSFRIEVEKLGTAAKLQDAATIILNHISWEIVEPQYIFQSIGDSPTIFNLQYHEGGLASAVALCDSQSNSFLDLGSNSILTKYSYSDFTKKNCSDIANPHSFGYKEHYDGNVITIQWDLRSIITCLAVII